MDAQTAARALARANEAGLFDAAKVLINDAGFRRFNRGGKMLAASVVELVGHRDDIEVEFEGQEIVFVVGGCRG